MDAPQEYYQLIILQQKKLETIRATISVYEEMQEKLMHCSLQIKKVFHSFIKSLGWDLTVSEYLLKSRGALAELRDVEREILQDMQKNVEMIESGE